MLNPFYIVLVFVLYVTRWVCATLLIYFCYCFICLRCGYVKPFYIFFSFWFYMLPGGYVKPFSCTFIFGFICYLVGM